MAEATLPGVDSCSVTRSLPAGGRRSLTAWFSRSAGAGAHLRGDDRVVLEGSGRDLANLI